MDKDNDHGKNDGEQRLESGEGDTMRAEGRFIEPQEPRAEPGQSEEQAGTGDHATPERLDHPIIEEPHEKPEKRTTTELLYGVIANPVETLRYVAKHKLVAAGILIYVAVAWIGAFASIPGSLNSFEQIPEISGLPMFSPRSIIVFTIVGTPFFSLLWLVVYAGILHLIASLLKGKGEFPGLVSAVGFASFPMIISTPFSLLDYVMGIGISLYGLISLPFTIWTIVLTIIGVRENYNFSTARAVWTFFIPLIALFLLAILLVIGIIALFVGALSR
ncbi:MAG: YIP1 family protein [Actinobacteria bacterium]|nr:YIP1 family protein [Actinomycetota bacterium]